MMKLSRPKVITWWIAIALGVLGVLGQLSVVPALAAYAFVLVAAGLVLLAAAVVLKNL